MAQHEIDNQHLLDRAAIHDVIARYFQGLDRCDPDMVRLCFTEDIRALYDERTPVRGIEAMMASMRTFKRMNAGEMKTTTHFMGNLNFNRLEKDIAETETNAIAFLVRPGQGAGQIAMRSLRYLDKLRRAGDGWRICERLHTLDWSCEMPATFAVTLAQRISTRPERAA
jgi:ketosteroid isomerase-like protein